MSLFLGLGLAGCNSVFFQPDAEIYSEPTSFSPPALEHFLTVGNAFDDKGEPDRIHVWTLLPRSPPKGIVVHFHGNAQNLTSHVHFLSWIVAEGYGLVTFDYRGYGRSSGTPSRQRAIEDGEAVLASTAKAYASLPLVVVAQSLGGALGTVAVARFQTQFPGRLQGLVLDSTFGSWRDLARRKLAQAVVTWPLQFPLSYLVSDELSASEALAQLDLPLFQTHAVDDAVVPFEAGLALARAARTNVPLGEAGWPPRFLATTGGHTSAFTPSPGNVRKALLAFLESATKKQKPEKLAPTVE